MKVLSSLEYNNAIRHRNINIMVLTQDLEMKLKKYNVKEVRMCLSLIDMKMYYAIEFNNRNLEYDNEILDFVFLGIGLNAEDTTRTIKVKQEDIIKLVQNL